MVKSQHVIKNFKTNDLISHVSFDFLAIHRLSDPRVVGFIAAIELELFEEHFFLS